MENSFPEWEYPHISGLDAAGIIEETGAGVSNWKPGDKVFFTADLPIREDLLNTH
ncbi:alcohol dehydrogenase catalytic domain-containing protein [Alteribacillus sp. JSM 102045]|uniref:alcohol dehydrogenase catalytic domain-containing protein n=1 Tax=Alteribacillus sp. JSM 102045 TaxID=1562101 RepID=UPI0035C211B7